MRLLSVVFSTVLAVATLAQESAPVSKPAWQWSTAERLAARISPALAAARVRESREAASRGASSDSIPQPNSVDVILGSQHPELFFSSELFENLIRMSSGGDRDFNATSRETYDQGRIAAKLPPSFWPRFDLLTAESRDLNARVESAKLAAGLAGWGGPAMDEYRRVTNALCHANASALSTLRTEFGREKVDRFLYAAVAPSMFITYLTSPDEAQLRAKEEGCK